MKSGFTEVENLAAQAIHTRGRWARLTKKGLDGIQIVANANSYLCGWRVSEDAGKSTVLPASPDRVS